MLYMHGTFRRIACLQGGGGPQVGEVASLGGVTRPSIESLILIWSRLHDRWRDLLRVTSPTWSPPPSCKQALNVSLDFTKCLQLLSKESRRKPDAMNL